MVLILLSINQVHNVIHVLVSILLSQSARARALCHVGQGYQDPTVAAEGRCGEGHRRHQRPHTVPRGPLQGRVSDNWGIYRKIN